jgi:hypothetical protein
MQIIWLVIQCVARAALHLPIAELEITTLAFVLCSLSAFAFWWHKPRDVRTPTLIEVSVTDGLAEEPHDYRYLFNDIEMFFMTGVAIGAIHLIGWDFSFPALTEKWL